METTKVFSDLLSAYLNPAIRIIVLRGSTRSSKTYSALQLLDYIARKSRTPRFISVVSESLPHLKRGCIRDFTNILQGEKVWSAKEWNATDKLYAYPKSTIEFFGVENAAKVHGAQRDILYCNEGINIEWEVYRQLAIRTAEKIIIDYNPAFESYIETKILTRPDAVMIHSTYRDNDMLSAAQIAEIESNRELDPEWWKVYGEGLVGTREGLVVKNWDIVAGLPSAFKRRWLGIDFGWSAPTAIMLVVEAEGGEVYIDEIAYLPNLDNPDIARIIKEKGLDYVEAICDKAEPKSIKELRALGINAHPSDIKDIDLGIKVMNRFKKHYTARSLNSIEENRKYRYGVDDNGNYTGKPIDKDNHAKDAERYVFLNRLAADKLNTGSPNIT